MFDEIHISRLIYVHNYHLSVTLFKCTALSKSTPSLLEIFVRLAPSEATDD